MNNSIDGTRTLIIFIVLALLILPVSAFDFDNVKKDIPRDKDGKIDFDGKKIDPNPLWDKYKPIKIDNAFGLGATLFEGYVDKNTESCGSNCESEVVIKLNQDSALIDSIKFKRLIDGDWVDSKPRSYKVYIKGEIKQVDVNDYTLVCDNIGVYPNGSIKESCNFVVTGTHKEDTPEWISYDIGDVMPAGVYTVKISGDKRNDWIYDWIITSQGKEITEWAVWGGSPYVAEEIPSLTLGSSSTPTALYGIRIKVFYDTTLINVTRYHGTTVSRCILYENPTGSTWGSSVDSGTFVGENCNLDYPLEAGKDYKIGIDNNVATYTMRYSNGPSFPYKTGLVVNALNYTSGVDSTGADDTGTWYGIGNLTIDAGGTIDLVSPINNYISPVNSIDFNFSALRFGGAYLDNATLWLNSTGTWRRNKTISAPGSTLAEESTVASPNALATEASAGMLIMPKSNIIVNNVTIADGSAATQCIIGTTIGGTDACSTATVVGSLCTFTNCELSANTPYYVGVSQGGSSFDTKSINYATPIIGTGLNYTKSWAGSTEYDNQVRGIKSMGVTIMVSSGNAIINQVLGYPTLWGIEVCDTDSYCAMSENRTVVIDTDAPTITIIYPNTTLAGLTNGQNLSLNYTITDNNVNACWREYNSTNTTISCTANSSFLYIAGINSIRVWANDTAGNLGYDDASWTPTLTVNSITYNNSTYETASETFTVNATDMTTAQLVYNGVSYTATVSGDIATKALDVPATAGNYSFYWALNGAYNTLSYNQSVNTFTYRICNTTLLGVTPSKVLNITFKDEVTEIFMNATIDASTWQYHLGTGTVNKTLVFSNNTHNKEYTFCMSPPQAGSTLTVYSDLQYSNEQSTTITYPNRHNIYSGALSNSSMTNQTYYLLSFTDGVSGIYNVQTTGGSPIKSAYIRVQRTISGNLVQLTEDYTDDAGTAPFFLNPSYTHTLTVSKSGYATQVLSIKPVAGTYTIIMASSDSYFNYTSPKEGITYSISPKSGTLTDGVYNFSFMVYSRNNNIYNCSFYIRTNEGTLLANGSAVGCVSVTGGQGGYASTMINITGYSKLYGQYFYTTTNRTIKVEGDARWRLVPLTRWESYRPTIGGAINDSIYLPEWGDDTRTTDFSRIVFFFIALAIALAIINLTTGYDTAYPGAYIYYITGIVVIMSGINGWMGPGYFYLSGATNHEFFCGSSATCNFATFIDNWVFAFHCILLTLIFLFSTNRRYQSG